MHVRKRPEQYRSSSFASMKNHSKTRRSLANVARALALEKKFELEEMKACERHLDRPDFLWHILIQSFGTMGRAKAWANLSKPENYDRLKYDSLAVLSDSQRLSFAERVFRDAKVRMPSKKAKYIVGCFERVSELGGPEPAKNELLRQSGRDAKIRFLKTFPGIGDKYARNILMDVYHSDFRDCIAIDARIKGISKKLGLEFGTYLEHEQFYLAVARDAGLNGWELDRLIFNFTHEFSSRI